MKAKLREQKFPIFFLFSVFCILFSLGIYSSNHKAQNNRHKTKSFWGEIIKSDWLVNDDTLGGCNQGSQAMAATKFGYVLVWVDSRNGHDPDVYGCKLDSDGVIIGTVFLVNDDTTGSTQSFPSVEADSIGNFVVVWEDYRNGNKDIYGQRYDVTGIPLGSNFRIDDDTSRRLQYAPKVCVGPEGDFAIVWRDDRGTSPDIYGQVYDKSGSKVGNNFIVNDDTLPSAFQCYPDIACTGDSAFAIVWLDTRQGCNIYCQRYANWVTPVDSNFRVNDNVSNSSIQSPAIGSNGEGRTIIVWEDYREHSSYPNTYCQQYDSIWNPVDINFRVNDDTGSARQENPDVVVDSEGNVVVIWSDKRDDRRVPSVYGQRYDKSGNPDGGNFKANTHSQGKQWDIYSVVGVRKEGKFFIVWQDRSGKDTELMGQKYASDGTTVDSNFSVIPDEGMRDQEHPQVAMSLNGDFVITWKDERLGNSCIFAQRYGGDGEEAGVNFIVTKDTSRIAYSPGVAIDSAGDFVIAWFYRKKYKAALYLGDIYARKYNSAGVPISSEFKVNGDPDAPRCTPQVAIDKTGNFVVVWEDARNDSKRPDIYARKYFAGCTPIDTNFGVNQFLGKERSEAPAVAISENGEFVVVWQEGQGDVGLFDIYGQRYDSLGDTVGVNFEISDDPIEQNQQINPSVAMITGGNFVTVWEDIRKGNKDIYGQRYESWLPVGSNFRINDDADSIMQEAPAVAINPDSGSFIVTWTDYRNGNPQIMAQEFDDAGIPVGSNFQVNTMNPAYHLSSGEGLASCKEKVVFAWTDNRRLKEWDIYAKLMKWRFVETEEEKPFHKFSENLQIYPNPAIKKLSIEYSIAKKGAYKISMYDKSGRVVRKVTLPKREPGVYTTQLDISDFSSGVYFMRFEGSNITVKEKVVIFH